MAQRDARLRGTTSFEQCRRCASARLVLDAVHGHLRREAEIGGYEAAEEAADAIQQCYVNLGRVILSVPQTLLHAVAQESELHAARMEIRNRFQVRDNELETLSWAMNRESELGYPSGRVYLDGLTLAIASRLVARHSSLTDGVEQRNGGLTGYRLKQVLSFIEEQIAENLSLEKIAAIAGVSSSHLNFLFRRSMGCRCTSMSFSAGWNGRRHC